MNSFPIPPEEVQQMYDEFEKGYYQQAYKAFPEYSHVQIKRAIDKHIEKLIDFHRRNKRP